MILIIRYCELLASSIPLRGHPKSRTACKFTKYQKTQSSSGFFDARRYFLHAGRVCSPQRDVHRTWDTILKKLLELFTKNPESDLMLLEK